MASLCDDDITRPACCSCIANEAALSPLCFCCICCCCCLKPRMTSTRLRPGGRLISATSLSSGLSKGETPSPVPRSEVSCLFSSLCKRSQRLTYPATLWGRTGTASGVSWDETRMWLGVRGKMVEKDTRYVFTDTTRRAADGYRCRLDSWIWGCTW